MLRVGVTGGIGSGKSTVARRLAERGAVVIDADQVAREIMEPGEPVLEEVRTRFGDGVIRPDGTLDRAGLAGIVFTDPGALAALDAITGPAIGRRVARRRSEVPPGTVSVFDMPLLVERGLWVHEHVAVVVEAALETRVHRLVDQRGLDEQDARNRIAAQASDAERRAACDIVLTNDGTTSELADAVDTLWRDRLAPWNDNLVHSRPSRRPDRGAVVAPRSDWGERGARLVARVAHALRDVSAVTEVEHIGSTAVPHLPAKDVLDLQVGVRDLEIADSPAFTTAMREAGLVRFAHLTRDSPQPPDLDPDGWPKRVYGSTDPLSIAHVHVRRTGSPGWRLALLFRDWLTHEVEGRDSYAAEKSRLLAMDDRTSAYAAAKEPWFAAALPRAEAWATATSWTPR
ncbi:dephospho-CoA kinase [Intrasporangium calvum]|uniref:dephospho-CoA kinase n=1 Tax=Intrasporangium calvum TaxID=53358 RepID=UPI000DF5D782|nr:dephospho-CoA kinase [Intrasporangium calvum]AXG13246.1 dephospho-CoA kinase [Intrasporangium calvum]